MRGRRARVGALPQSAGDRLEFAPEEGAEPQVVLGPAGGISSMIVHSRGIAAATTWAIARVQAQSPAHPGHAVPHELLLRDQPGVRLPRRSGSSFATRP